MNSQSAAQSESEFAAFIGIDWADTKHDICLQAADSTRHEFAVLLHRPADIDDWVTSLRQRFHGKPVAICIETSRGALVYALQKYDFLVLFPINPATLAKYRQAFKPSRAKADPTDAQIALEILMSHRDKLKPLRPQSPAIRALTLLLEERRQIVDEQRRITNRLISNLKQYYPLAHEWFEDTPWRDMAILYRSFYPVGQAVERRLKAAGIPVSSKKEVKFTEDQNTVKLITMHSSKGLEFPIVAIPGVGIRPDDKCTTEEEVRLLYVAMTRATSRLYMTSHKDSAFTQKLQQAIGS